MALIMFYDSAFCRHLESPVNQPLPCNTGKTTMDTDSSSVGNPAGTAGSILFVSHMFEPPAAGGGFARAVTKKQDLISQKAPVTEGLRLPCRYESK